MESLLSRYDHFNLMVDLDSEPAEWFYGTMQF